MLLNLTLYIELLKAFHDFTLFFINYVHKLTIEKRYQVTLEK